MLYYIGMDCFEGIGIVEFVGLGDYGIEIGMFIYGY